MSRKQATAMFKYIIKIEYELSPITSEVVESFCL